MKYYANKNDVQAIKMNGQEIYKLLGGENGCVAGCCTGITSYTEAEYMSFGVHEDQEGFYVLEGKGLAKVGDEEIRLEPGVSFVVPAGKNHGIKRDSDSEPVSVFWFHSAI